MIFINAALLIVSFTLLFKCASLFVRGACGIAEALKMPKMVVGIVLVGLATTAPEFVVSVFAAFRGHPEIALGNAIGSVICDDGIALPLAAVLAPTVILVNCRLLRTVGVFLLSIDFIAYFLAMNGRITRVEGLVLVFLLVGYFLIILRHQNFRHRQFEVNQSCSLEPGSLGPSIKDQLKKPVLLFLAGLAGVVLTGNVIVHAAVFIAKYFSVSEIIIGSTIVAIGTSLPEISTCITAAVKGEGELAVGNIIGADVLNILWIVGVSAMVRPIVVDLSFINFAFPYMILIVVVMLASMRMGCRIGKAKGLVLFILYLGYLFLTIRLFI